MKKRNLLLIFAFVFCGISAFADKTIYVASAAAGNGSGADALNPCTFATALGNLASAGYTTFVLPENGLFQLSGGTNGYGRIPIADNSRIIIQGNNSVLEGTGGDTRILRAGVGTIIELHKLKFRLGNAASSLGGAIFFSGDSLKIDSCVFEKNTADNGAAIGSRGKHIVIKNSWFKWNYLRSSFQGGAISHTGTTTGGSLTIENTTFSNNTGKTGSASYGTAIITAFDGNVRNYLNTINISNCTFYQNNAGLSTTAGFAAVQLDYLGATAPAGTATIATFVNNTFHANKVAAINIKGKQQAIQLINNLIVGDSYANVSPTSIQDHGFITEYSVAEGRPQVVALNNYIVAKTPISTKVDDVALQLGNSNDNTLVATSSQNDIDLLALSSTLDSTSNKVPFLPIASSSSILLEAGISSYSGIVIPSYDIRGLARGGQDTGDYYDIGAYEFNYSSTTAVEKSLAGKNYTVVQTRSSINIQNNGGSRLSIAFYLLSGKKIYSGYVNSFLSVDKNQLSKGVVLMVVNDGQTKETKKVVL